MEMSERSGLSVEMPEGPRSVRWAVAVTLAVVPAFLFAGLAWQVFRDRGFAFDTYVGLAACLVAGLSGLAAIWAKKRGEATLMAAIGVAALVVGYVELVRGVAGARLDIPQATGPGTAAELRAWVDRAEKGGPVYKWIARRSIAAERKAGRSAYGSLSAAILDGLMNAQWQSTADFVAKADLEVSQVGASALRGLADRGVSADAAWSALQARESDLVAQARQAERQGKWSDAAKAWQQAQGLARDAAAHDSEMKMDELRAKFPVQLLLSKDGGWKAAAEVAAVRIGEDTVGLGSLPRNRRGWFIVEAAVRNNLPHPVRDVRATFLVGYPLGEPRPCGKVLLTEGPVTPGAVVPVRPNVEVDSRGLAGAEPDETLRQMLKGSGVTDEAGFDYLDEPQLYVDLKLEYAPVR
jgi:hypothetical protein